MTAVAAPTALGDVRRSMTGSAEPRTGEMYRQQKISLSQYYRPIVFTDTVDCRTIRFSDCHPKSTQK